MKNVSEKNCSLFILILTFTLLGVSPVTADTDSRSVCHGSGVGKVERLQVSTSAIPAHLNHGDSLPVTYFIDADADGSGDAEIAMTACSAPFGYVEDALDCDDLDSAVGPGAIDACGDGVDGDCSGSDSLCSSEIDGWRITAGPVTDSTTPGASVTGTFTLERLSETSALVRNGGACIVADLVSRGIGSASCNTDSDCTVVPGTLPAGSYGYCKSPDGSGEPKRCWTRVGNYTCTRGLQLPGTQELPPVLEADTPDDGNPIRWLVIACLANEINPRACALLDTANFVYSVGPVKTWEW